MGNLFQELKRRKVFRVAAVYAVVAWLLIQVSSTILPTFNAPGWVNQTIILVFFLGFPVALLLAWAYEITPEESTSTTHSGSEQSNLPLPTSAHPINYVILIIVILVAGFQVVDRIVLNTASVESEIAGSPDNLQHTEILNLILDESIRRSGLGMPSLSLSSDGNALLFSNTTNDSTGQILVRRFSEPTSRVIFESERATRKPIFSPDNQQVLFDHSGTGLEVISIQGGASRLVTSFNNPNSGFDWIDIDSILFVGMDNAIYRQDIGGGAPQLLYQGEQEPLVNPVYVSDQETLIFVQKSDPLTHHIYISDLNTDESNLLVSNAGFPKLLSTGHLLFIRDNDLWGALLDIDLQQFSTDPVLLVKQVSRDFFWNIGAFEVSDQGRLVYERRVVTTEAPTVPIWLFSDGSEEIIPIAEGLYSAPRLSPDESKLALLRRNSMTELGADIWIYDFLSQVVSRLTFDNDAVDLVWAPDGSSLYYGRAASGIENQIGIWKVAADGLSNPEKLLGSNLELRPKDINSDGSQLIFVSGTGAIWETRVLDLVSGLDEPLVPHSRSEYEIVISNDDEWIAFTRTDFGDHAIFMSQYESPENREWLAIEGARQPLFAPSGNKLYYMDWYGSQDLMERDILSTTPLSFGNPRSIASGIYREVGSPPTYEISEDGERVIILRRINETGYLAQSRRIELVVVNNWFEQLRSSETIN